ncbi:TIGR04255 family protein [Agrobacterium vitis]
MAGKWLPLHENHAINVMALVIQFAEPITTPIYRKALAAADASTTKAGFASREQIPTYQISLQPGVPQTFQQPEMHGAVIYSSYFGSAISPISPLEAHPYSEQLQIEPRSIVYRTRSYVSWTWQKSRYFEIINPIIDAVSGIVETSAVRFEYQDQFTFDGRCNEADVRLLFRDNSPYLAPHVYEELGTWHSHTGCFLPSADTTKKLLQINVDAVDTADAMNTQRLVNITTARENRYAINLDGAGDVNKERIASILDLQHEELKAALRALINSNTASQIYLEG